MSPAQPAAQFREAMIRIRSSDSVGSCRDESAVPNVDHARSDGGRQRQPICSAAPQPVDGAKGSAHLRPAIGRAPPFDKCSCAYRNGWEATMSVASRNRDHLRIRPELRARGSRGRRTRQSDPREHQGSLIASQKVVVVNGRIVEYRVTLNVTFVLR